MTACAPSPEALAAGDGQAGKIGMPVRRIMRNGKRAAGFKHEYLQRHMCLKKRPIDNIQPAG